MRSSILCSAFVILPSACAMETTKLPTACRVAPSIALIWRLRPVILGASARTRRRCALRRAFSVAAKCSHSSRRPTRADRSRS